MRWAACRELCDAGSASPARRFQLQSCKGNLRKANAKGRRHRHSPDSSLHVVHVLNPLSMRLNPSCANCSATPKPAMSSLIQKVTSMHDAAGTCNRKRVRGAGCDALRQMAQRAQTEPAARLADDLEDEVLGQQVRRHLALQHESQRRRHLVKRHVQGSEPGTCNLGTTIFALRRAHRRAHHQRVGHSPSTQRLESR